MGQDCPALPDVPLPVPEKLPTELREAKAWILWRAEWVWKKGRWKLNKVPCDAQGRNRDMTDPAIHGGIREALNAVEALRRAKGGNYFGIGLTFCALPGVVGVDFDGDLDGGVSDRLN